MSSKKPAALRLRGARVLVTGGTGFIGSHLARRLLLEGAEVHLLARPEASKRNLADCWKRMRRHLADLGDAAAVAACARRSRPEFVFHLARPRGDRPSYRRNLAGSLNLARALARGAPGLRRLVRTAQAVAPEYGGDDGDAQLAADLADRYLLPVVTLKLAKVYGPAQDPRDFPVPMIRQALRRGLIRPRGALGWQDLVHVEDVVRAYLLAATKPGIESSRIEIGSGGALSDADVAAALARVLGMPVEAVSAPGEGARLIPADPRRARELLGWKPEVGMEEGLRRLAEGEAVCYTKKLDKAR